ncbi:D-erythronate dehydrogenase [Erwinia sp. B116]|uniref:D-erythronate dehydrogenase n=1 Tax=Erwinia sp. B116 TaxID=1561024 RepID=UPI000C77564D|nr:D-erythronate dehydrogenase [Erwinia sp. B116]PLV63236.1 NAD-dependent epimerase [Erwinia sp. B116]
MHIVVTGAAGFLGKKLIQALLEKGTLRNREGQEEPLTQIVAFDVVPLSGVCDPRLMVRSGDICNPATLQTLIDAQTDSVFHLAAILSGQAEQDFDTGMTINCDATRQLMQRLRALPRRVRLVITSSVAVFGGSLPARVTDQQVWQPQSSYGTQKAINDLLLADYSRRGFLDGRSLRLPTIAVRAGRPNAAASSFASGIIREPLNGETAVCPVNPASRLWLMSPNRAVQALIHGHQLDEARLTQGRAINLCGLSVTVEQMVAALRRIGGPDASGLIRYQPDREIINIVNSWPGDFTADYARQLGFQANDAVDELINEYLAEQRPPADG